MFISITCNTKVLNYQVGSCISQLQKIYQICEMLSGPRSSSSTWLHMVSWFIIPKLKRKILVWTEVQCMLKKRKSFQLCSCGYILLLLTCKYLGPHFKNKVGFRCIFCSWGCHMWNSESILQKIYAMMGLASHKILIYPKANLWVCIPSSFLSPKIFFTSLCLFVCFCFSRQVNTFPSWALASGSL